jgi:hypothetical protein
MFDSPPALNAIGARIVRPTQSDDRTWLLETELYPPVKRFLEDLGFTVKGEIGGCDIVAVKAGDPPLLVICELKLTFNLELILQAVDRAGACDDVWLAARFSRKGKGREGDARYRNLCRRLGFGMLGVTEAGHVEVLVSPPVGAPRKNPRKRARLLSEHARRRGDPSAGGSTRRTIMTAYRQRALDCAAGLADGPCRVRDLSPGIPEASKILQANHYGWFERASRGVYALTAVGRAALLKWPPPSHSQMEPKIERSVSVVELAEEQTP